MHRASDDTECTKTDGNAHNDAARSISATVDDGSYDIDAVIINGDDDASFLDRDDAVFDDATIDEAGHNHSAG